MNKEEEGWVWRGIGEEDYSLDQFDFDTGKENLFKDLDQDKLMIFELRNKEGDFFAVDLITGSLIIQRKGSNQMVLAFDGYDMNTALKEKFRLVYFRRVRKTFSIGSSDQTTSVVPHLGWQITIDGKNHQRVMAILDKDNIVFKTK